MISAVAALIGCLASIGLAVSLAPLGFDGYVSEAGVPGTAHSGLYQLSVLGIAVASALLAFTLRRPFALAALALAVAAPAMTISAAVPCTTGCPLPPYETTTARDLIHAAGSLAGVGACALAMLALAWSSSGPLRRVAQVAMAVSWPLLLGTAVSIVAAGRGTLTGTLERASLALCLLWIITIAVLLRKPPHPNPTQPANLRPEPAIQSRSSR